MTLNIADLDKMLQQAFDESSKIYKERGFQRRIGFGKKPALISVDLANAWTRPGNPFTCEKVDEQIIPAMQKLLRACRDNGHVVVHVTTAYQNPNRQDPHTDMGLWHHKIPIEAVDLKDEHLWAIDSRIAPVDGEWVMLEEARQRLLGHAACRLSPLLRCRHDPGHRRDGHGLRAHHHLRRPGRRLPHHRPARGDRRSRSGAVAWNLYDIDAKFADVEPVDRCVEYLNSVQG